MEQEQGCKGYGVTYQELESWLTARKRRTDMDSILTFLQQCVEDEMEVLLEEEIRSGRRSRRSQKLEEQCRREAQEHYAEEISELIDSGWNPSPWAVISYRRKPKAWAVAGAIKQQTEREQNG